MEKSQHSGKKYIEWRGGGGGYQCKQIIIPSPNSVHNTLGCDEVVVVAVSIYLLLSYSDHLFEILILQFSSAKFRVEYMTVEAWQQASSKIESLGRNIF